MRQRRPPISYSNEELAWIKDNCTLVIGELHKQFAEIFNRSDVTSDNLHALRKRKGWRTGRTGQYEKGGVGCNPRGAPPKGGNKTSFKKGDIPQNTRPLYSERVCAKDGYILIKIPEKNPYTGAKTRFKHKHIWLWEKHNGSIPEGHVVIFLDGNKLNCVIENLACVPRSVLVHLNKHLKASEFDSDLKPTLVVIARLRDAAFKRSVDC